MPRSDHGWPPGPRTVTRRRTDPTPAVLIASSIWPSTATNAPTSRSSSSALAPRRSPRPSSPTVAARTTGRVSGPAAEVAREVQQRGHRDRVVPDPGRGEAAVALRERDLGPLGEDGVEVGGEDDRVRALRAARRGDDVAGLVDARRDARSRRGGRRRAPPAGPRRTAAPAFRADAARVRDDPGGGAVLRRRHGACILSRRPPRGRGPGGARRLAHQRPRDRVAEQAPVERQHRAAAGERVRVEAPRVGLGRGGGGARGSSSADRQPLGEAHARA